jgi:hypothetical protein
LGAFAWGEPGSFANALYFSLANFTMVGAAFSMFG